MLSIQISTMNLQFVESNHLLVLLLVVPCRSPGYKQAPIQQPESPSLHPGQALSTNQRGTIQWTEAEDGP